MQSLGARRPGEEPTRWAARIALTLLVAAALGCASWPGRQAGARGSADAGDADAGDAQPVLYTVQPGDTLSAIARAHGTSVAALAAWNGISDPDRIRAGAVLRVSAEARAPEPLAAPEDVVVVAPAAEPAPQQVAVATRDAAPAPEAVAPLAKQAAPEPEETAVVAPAPSMSDRDRIAHARADLVDGELLFRAARFEDALAAAERARSLLAGRGDAESRAVRARASLLSGMVRGALGDGDGARACFRDALSDDSSIQLPDPAPPKLAKLFEAARADAPEAQGP